MKKEFSFTLPGVKEKQLSFKQAVMRMLNCRKYLNLRSQEGVREVLLYEDYDTGVDHYLSGTVEFSDGLKVDNHAFKECMWDRDSLLEKMVAEECEFKRSPVFGGEYHREKVIRTSFTDGRVSPYQRFPDSVNYLFRLSVIDTTKKKAGFPAGLFSIKPRDFAFNCTIELDKDSISEQDLRDFEAYRRGLEKASASELLVPKTAKEAKREQEKYGRLISSEEAQVNIISRASFLGSKDVPKGFLGAYNLHTNPNKRTAVKYQDSSFLEYFIISKSKEDERIEVTIRGGSIFPPPLAILKIGLRYDGNDIAFKPKVAVRDFRPYDGTEVEELNENFPLFLERRYGAIIKPKGDLKNPTVRAIIRDERLEGLANKLVQSINDSKIFTPKLVYCATPSRIAKKKEQIMDFVTQLDLGPLHPFQALEYERFEGGPISREKSMEYCLRLIDISDEFWMFGVSNGTLEELVHALELNKPVKIFFKQWDPEWRTYYEKLGAKYGNPLEGLVNHWGDQLLDMKDLKADQ